MSVRCYCTIWLTDLRLDSISVKFHSVRGRLKLKGYRGRQYSCKLVWSKSSINWAQAVTDTTFEISNIYIYIYVQLNKLSVGVFLCVQYRSTDIQNSAGPSFHSTLLMAPEKQLLKLLQAHIHILHCIWNLHSTHTHPPTHRNMQYINTGSLTHYLNRRAALGQCVYACVHCILYVYIHLWSCVSTYLSRAGLLLLRSTIEATEPLPSRTDWTIATGRTGGSEEHTSQDDVKATASPPPTLPPFPAPLTPGLTGSSLISIMHFSLLVESSAESQ